MGTVAAIARALILALQIFRDITERMEREKISGEAMRDYVNTLWEEHRAKIAEAEQIRARTRAELDAASPDELRQHPDARFRD